MLGFIAELAALATADTLINGPSPETLSAAELKRIRELLEPPAKPAFPVTRIEPTAAQLRRLRQWSAKLEAEHSPEQPSFLFLLFVLAIVIACIGIAVAGS